MNFVLPSDPRNQTLRPTNGWFHECLSNYNEKQSIQQISQKALLYIKNASFKFPDVAFEVTGVAYKKEKLVCEIVNQTQTINKKLTLT